MPVSYQIRASRIDTIAHGQVSVQDFHQHLLERSRDDRVGDGLCELIDATQVTKVTFSPFDVPHLVKCQEQHAYLFYPIPLAIVATDPLAFGFARSFETLTGRGNRLIRVCATRRDAERWLDAVARTPRPTPGKDRTVRVGTPASSSDS
jgi:hypothetical protein